MKSISFILLCLIIFFACEDPKNKTNISSSHRLHGSLDTLNLFQCNHLKELSQYFHLHEPDGYISNKSILMKLRGLATEYVSKKYNLHKKDGAIFSEIQDSLKNISSQLADNFQPKIFKGCIRFENAKEKSKVIFFSEPYNNLIYAEVRTLTWPEYKNPNNNYYSGAADAYLFEFKENTGLFLTIKSEMFYN